MAYRFALARSQIVGLAAVAFCVGCGGTVAGAETQSDAGENAKGTDGGVAADAGAGWDAAAVLGLEPVDASLCYDACECNPANACPAIADSPTGSVNRCYVSHTIQVNGAASEPFCSNGVVDCSSTGLAMSFGASPLDNDGSDGFAYVCGTRKTPIPIPGGPDGAFCCANAPAGGDARDDATDGGNDSGNADATNGSAGTFGATCSGSATFGDAAVLTGNSSCEDGGWCLFPIDAGCATTGVCFYPHETSSQSSCQSAVGMCACNGRETLGANCEAPGYAFASVPSPTAFQCPSDGGGAGDAAAE